MGAPVFSILVMPITARLPKTGRYATAKHGPILGGRMQRADAQTSVGGVPAQPLRRCLTLLACDGVTSTGAVRVFRLSNCHRK